MDLKVGDFFFFQSKNQKQGMVRPPIQGRIKRVATKDVLVELTNGKTTRVKLSSIANAKI